LVLATQNKGGITGRGTRERAVSAPAGAVAVRRGSDAPALELWAAGALLAIGVTAALVTAPILLVVALALAAVSAVFIAAFAQPRWLIVLHLALVIGFVPIILAERVGIPISHQTIVMLLIFSLAARRLIGAERHSLPRETALLAALVVASLASLGLAYDRGRAGIEIVELIEVALFALLAVMLIDDARWLRRALWSVALSAGVLGALATFQQLAGLHDYEFFGFSAVDTGDRALLRSEGPIDPNFFGQTLVAGAALALYLGLDTRRWPVRALAFSASLACLGGVYFSHSRGALLAVVVAGAVAAVLRRVPIWIPAAGAAAVAAVVFTVLPAEARERLTEVVKPGESGIAHASDASLANRFAENIAAASMYRDHPLVGVGPGNYSVVYLDYAQRIGLDQRAEERTGVEQAAHNLYLEALAELGTVGGLAFFAVLAMAFLGAWRARTRLPGRDALLGEGVLVALAGFFTASLFLHNAYQHYLWLMVALGLAAGHVARRAAPTR
jgi:O-antigen ligase